MKKVSAKKTKPKKAGAAASQKSAAKPKAAKKPLQRSGASRPVAKTSKGKATQVTALRAPKIQKAEPPAKVGLASPSPASKTFEAGAQAPVAVQKIPPAVSVKPKQVVPAAAVRVDLPPETGFSVVVDGHFKAQHAAEAVALAEAKALKTRFPFLRIEIFDALKKKRSSVG